MGELSVRIIVPMDMKQLQCVSQAHLLTVFHAVVLPKRRGRPEHILTQRPQHAIGTWAEAYDVRCAEDESDDQADRYVASAEFLPISATHLHVLPPIIAPILAANRQSSVLWPVDVVVMMHLCQRWKAQSCHRHLKLRAAS